MRRLEIECISLSGRIFNANENLSMKNKVSGVKKSTAIYYICGCCDIGKFFYSKKSKKLCVDECHVCGAEFIVKEK